MAPRVAPSRPTPPGRKRRKGNRALGGGEESSEPAVAVSPSGWRNPGVAGRNNLHRSPCRPAGGLWRVRGEGPLSSSPSGGGSGGGAEALFVLRDSVETASRRMSVAATTMKSWSLLSIADIGPKPLPR